MHKPNAKKKGKATIEAKYKGFERKEGDHTFAKVAGRVTLQMPKYPTRAVFEKHVENYRVLQEAGVPVAKFKAAITIAPGKATERKAALVYETLRPATYKDMVDRVGAINDVLENISRKEMWVNFRPKNIGIDKSGKLKLFDVYSIKKGKEQLRQARFPDRSNPEAIYKENVKRFLVGMKKAHTKEEIRWMRELLLKEHENK